MPDVGPSAAGKVERVRMNCPGVSRIEIGGTTGGIYS